MRLSFFTTPTIGMYQVVDMGDTERIGGDIVASFSRFVLAATTSDAASSNRSRCPPIL